MKTCKRKEALEDMFWTILDSIIEETRLAKLQGYTSICYSPYEESPYDYLIKGDLFENFTKSDVDRTKEEFEVLVDVVMEIVSKEVDDIIKTNKEE